MHGFVQVFSVSTIPDTGNVRSRLLKPSRHPIGLSNWAQHVVSQQQVYIIDDEQDVRLTLEAVVSGAGYRARKFASATQFLAESETDIESCVLADVRMPGMNGLELQEEIARRKIPASTIIMTGHADVGLAVRAMKAGAFHFLEKPFSNQELLELLPSGFGQARHQLGARRTQDNARVALSRLSARQFEIAQLVSEGHINKSIAAQLSLSVRTVETHRAHLMTRLGIANAAQLIQIFAEARIGRTNLLRVQPQSAR